MARMLTFRGGPQVTVLLQTDLPAPITIKRAGKRNAGGLLLLSPFKNDQPLITGPSTLPLQLRRGIMPSRGTAAETRHWQAMLPHQFLSSY
jgi:hypothetical protein